MRFPFAFFRFSGYKQNMLDEYDISSSAVSPSFAKTNCADPGQLRIPHQKSIAKSKISTTN